MAVYDKGYDTWHDFRQYILGVLWGLHAVAEKVFAQTLSLIGFSLVPFSEYWWQILLVFVAIGLFTGGFGSLVSMAKYLK